MTRGGIDPSKLNAVLMQQARNDAVMRVQIYELMVTDRYSRVFSESRAYTNIVMGAGYAGFLTFLGIMRDKLPDECALVAGILFVVSLSSYIFNEIWNMITSSEAHVNAIAQAIALHDLRLAAGTNTPDELVQKAETIMQLGKNPEAEYKFNIWQQKVWRVCFPVAVVSAYGAAMLLICGLVYESWRSML